MIIFFSLKIDVGFRYSDLYIETRDNIRLQQDHNNGTAINVLNARNVFINGGTYDSTRRTANDGQFAVNLSGVDNTIKIDNATDAILPSHGSAINIGASNDRFKQVHATQFYGDGQFLTGVAKTGANTFTSNQTISKADPKLILNDTNTGGTSYSIFSDGGQFRIYNESSGGGIRFTVTSNGSVFTSNNLSVSGNISASGTATISSTFTAQGTSYLNGEVNLGDSNSDDIKFYGSLDTDIIPKTDNK